MSRKWYIAQTYSGQENSVAEDLQRRIESMGFQDKIYQVLSPEETYIEKKKDGKEVEKTRKIYPGYIFIEMEVDKDVDERAWFMIRNTPKVTGFLGSSGNGTKPNAVPQSEMNEVLMKIGKVEKPTFEIKPGDFVELVGGPFAGQRCEVSAVNEQTEILTVLLDMFGRLTPSEQPFNNVKKVENN